MKVWITFLAFVAALSSSLACRSQPQSSAGPAASESSPQQVAWKAIHDGAPLIDVRTDAEFQAGHLPGATLIPYDQITSRVSELPPDKSQTIVVYCRTGRRSGIAKQDLERLGYTKVINAGGYAEMTQAQP